MNLISSFERLSGNASAELKRISSQPEVKRELDYYLANIGKVKSLDAFLADTRLYDFAVKAFGLEDMQFAKAFMRKVLTEGIDRPEAFSLRLADKRFREFASVFNFNRYGAATTSFDAAHSGVADRFLRARFERQSGEESEALRLALYFERNAKSVTSALGLLADKALYQVARTALGLPDAMSGVDIDKQAQILGQKIDFTRLDEPAYVKKMITRFLARQADDGSQAAPSPVAALLSGGSGGVDMKLIQSLQRLRKFGS